MAKIADANEMMFTRFQPKAQNRYLLYIEGVPTYLIKTASRPSLSINKVTLDHINLKRHVAGKAEWGDVSLTLYDPVTPSAAQAVMEWVRLCHESVTGRNGYADFYKKDLTLVMLDPVGAHVEEWTLKGAFITSADFGGLDWASDSPNEISLTLSVDLCVLQY